MANVTINTSINNVTDSQSTTLTASLDGIPNTSSAIITSRTFTPITNYTFTKIPHVSFAKTSDPNRYNYSIIKNVNGSYSITVNYLRALAQPTTDIIEFFAEAKTNATVVGNKVYGWNMKTTEIKPHGESRTLSIVGDPGAKLTISVTENPRIGPEANASFLVNSFTATIGANGKHETTIRFPASTLATSYRILLTEFVSGTFTNGLADSPTTIFLSQWPLQQTKLEIIETGTSQSWALPAASINNAFYYFSGARGSKSYKQDFSWTVTHDNNISKDQDYVAARFTQVTGQGSTLTETTLPSTVTYDNLTYVIDNTGIQSVVISGQITITHGYDSGGYTYITLNINDILNHA